MDRFLPLLLVIVAMYGGCQLFTINKGKSSEVEKEGYKVFCENSVKTMANLQNEYTELKIKNSKSYNYKYDYLVDGKSYTGSVTQKEMMQVPVIEVFYDSENPEKVMTSDPCVLYANIKDNPEAWPQWFEYVGAGLFLLALVFLKGSAVRAIRGR